MRIGVLTHSAGDDNYGQLLQCFALQQYLKQCGHNSFLIQHKVDSMPRKEKFKSLKNVIRYLRALISPKYRKSFYMLVAIERQRHINENRNLIRQFKQFKIDNIELSKLYNSLDELRADPPQADAYIVGSDQVWSSSLDRTSTLAWYLQFGPKEVRRISYAASFGREVRKTEFKYLYKLLSNFTAVSVREYSALEYCIRAGINNVKLVLDPTLLVSKEVYMTFVKKDGVNNPYLFLYYINVIDKDELAWDQINSFLLDHDLQLRSVSSSGYYPAFDLIPEHENLLLTIPEWLNSIYNSEYVVTTSFHGVAFAIIMHRPFVAILLNGVYCAGNDRIISLLDRLSLRDHILSTSNSLETILKSPIDWDMVEQLLVRYRKESEDFLSQALER